MNKNYVHYAAMILLWVGGLNWGVYGLFGVDLVQMLFGASALSQIVYVLVGASALYTLVTHKEACEICMNMGKPAKKGKKK